MASLIVHGLGFRAARALLQFGMRKILFLIAVFSTCAYCLLYFNTHDKHTVNANDYKIEYEQNTGLGPKSIAVCMGLCFRGTILNAVRKHMKGAELFSVFLPSFCTTISRGYSYHFYIAYDFDDPILSTMKGYSLFNQAFTDVVQKKCTHPRNITLQLVKLPHSGKPAWAQNDACMEAYIDGADYLYRVNDDTLFTSSGWTERFIHKLGNYTPPNVGVVGPTHTYGNTAILTYDFTHRTHIEIFGVHYPRIYRGWFADDWITHIYQPHRTTKLRHVTVKHTGKYGMRYRLYKQFWPRLKNVEQKSTALIQRYIEYKKSRVAPDGKKVVSMSFYGNNRTYTYGAIRNAQLLPVLYPGWTLRVYVGASGSPFAVPQRITRLLVRLNADVREINPSTIGIPPRMWRLLVANDLSINYFLIRDADSRLSERDYNVTSRLVEQDKPFLCVRDHVTHCNCSVPQGLWGGKPAWFQVSHLSKSILTQLEKSKLTERFFIEKTLDYRNTSHQEMCENVIECDGKISKNTSETFAYIGRLHDEFGEFKRTPNRCES